MAVPLPVLCGKSVHDVQVNAALQRQSGVRCHRVARQQDVCASAHLLLCTKQHRQLQFRPATRRGSCEAATTRRTWLPIETTVGPIVLLDRGWQSRWRWKRHRGQMEVAYHRSLHCRSPYRSLLH